MLTIYIYIYINTYSILRTHIAYYINNNLLYPFQIWLKNNSSSRRNVRSVRVIWNWKAKTLVWINCLLKRIKKRDIRFCCPAHTPYYNIISHTHTSYTIINNWSSCVDFPRVTFYIQRGGCEWKNIEKIALTNVELRSLYII